MDTFSREKLDPWYVTGFVEGEGTFTFSRNGRNMALYFAIKLTAADERVLEQIREFFGQIGRIYRVKPRRADSETRSGWTKEARYYRVCRLDELSMVADHFVRYPLRGGKADSFRIWNEMFQTKRTFRRPQRILLEALAIELSRLSPRNRPWSPDPRESG